MRSESKKRMLLSSRPQKFQEPRTHFPCVCNVPSGASFTTKSHDTDTGVYYFWRRWYHAKLGRFTSKAPYPPNIEHPYSYAENRPSMLIDPKGKFVLYPHYILGAMLPCIISNRDSLDRIYTGGSDKFKHCLLSCRVITECCPWTTPRSLCKFIMRNLGRLREVKQSLLPPYPDYDKGDIAGNEEGFSCSDKIRNCEECCNCKYPAKFNHTR